MATPHSFYGLIVFHCIYIPFLFIYSSIDGHLGCFYILSIGNNAAMNIGVHVGKVSEVTQSCLPICNPMDCIVHGILQARILERIAFPFSRLSSQPRD